MLEDRFCSKSTCSREAVATLTYDYAEATVVVGPLGLGSHSYGRTPHTYDLCAEHADRLTVPRGWRLIRPNPSAA